MDLINTNFYAGLVRLTAEVINTQIWNLCIDI
jgi:hypothetical protein